MRPLLWTSVGQSLSSLSNLLLSLAVARGSGLDGLGKFAVGLSTYLLVVAFQRALVTDPLLVIRRPCTPGGIEERGALTCCLAVGAVAGVAVLAVGIMTGQPQLVALGPFLPLMTAQDGIRFVAFRRLDARAAAVIDAVWVGVSAMAWIPATTGSAATAVALWGIGAVVSFGFGMVLLGVRPTRPRLALEWWRRDAGRLGLALGMEAALASAAMQTNTFVVAGVLGVEAVGALRSAQIIVGPAIMLLTAYNAFALPRFAAGTVAVTSREAARASLTTVGLVAPVLVFGWTAGGPLARVLFGPDSRLDRPILLGLAVGTVVAAATVGLVLYLKVTRRGGPLVAARLATAVAGLALVAVVAGMGRVEWLGWAIAAQTTVYLVALAFIVRLRPPGIEGRGSATPAGSSVSPGYVVN